MKRDLLEISEIDESLKGKLNDIKEKSNSTSRDINEVKLIKNQIFEKTSRVFIYNLKKLIQLESTQRLLASKIGVSEDLLSKYKSGEAFPSIDTLIYICEIYGIALDKLIGGPLDAADMEALENRLDRGTSLFEEKYYTYFLVTNIEREGYIHEATMEFSESKVEFKILSRGEPIKCFTGSFSSTDKLIYFNLESLRDGFTYICMMKPNVNRNKYVGGLGILMLSSDANSKPCAQRILFSRSRLDRELLYNDLKDILSFQSEECSFGNVKIQQSEDEAAYRFILNQCVNYIDNTSLKKRGDE